MADHRPEVNLEIASGFFRIPTESVVYNLTVLGSGDGRLPVVERIVEQERCQGRAAGSGEVVLERLAGELEPLARRLLAGDTASQLASCRQELAAVLQELASAPPPEAASPAASPDRLQGLAGRIEEMAALLRDAGGSAPDGPAEAAPDARPAAAAGEERYVFDLDVVFQTLYELCTNEQVKTHISTARQNRDTYFDRDVFLQEINRIVAGLEPDADNFFNVPLSDLLAALLAGCREKPIRNLLKKMDANQAAIFLDQVLPLEVPPKEEVAAAPAPPPPGPPAAPPGDGGDLAARLLPLLAGLQEDVAALAAEIAPAPAQGGDAPAASPGTGPAVERLRRIDTQLAGLAASLAGETGRRLAALTIALHDTARRAKKGEGDVDELFASSLDAAGGRVASLDPAAVAEALASDGD